MDIKILTLKYHVKVLFQLTSVNENYSIRNFRDDFLFRFRAIETWEPVNTWNTILITKLDTHTDERWEEASKIKLTELNTLFEFLVV